MMTGGLAQDWSEWRSKTHDQSNHTEVQHTKNFKDMSTNVAVKQGNHHQTLLSIATWKDVDSRPLTKATSIIKGRSTDNL